MPDVGQAEYQMGRQRRVIVACERLWPQIGVQGRLNKSDCSAFVIAVAREIGILMAGPYANDIYREVSSAPWQRVGVGNAAAQMAAVAATNGKFVVGAWRNPTGGHGHVAVIVDTSYSSPQIPFRSRAIAYWGTLGAIGERYQKHSDSWNSAKQAQVLYAVRDIAAG